MSEPEDDIRYKREYWNRYARWRLKQLRQELEKELESLARMFAAVDDRDKL